MTDVPSPPRPFRRHVYYVGGFYTGGPPFYHGGLVREAARHARVQGRGVEVTVATEIAQTELVPRYRLRASGPDGEVETTYALLRWEDIVLDRMARPWTWRLREMAATFVDYLGNGVVRHMLTHARRFAFVWLYPFVAYALALVVAAGLGLAVDAALRGLGFEGLAFLPGLLASALGLLSMSALYRRGYGFLLLNDFLFSREVAQDRAPEFWPRIDAFADEVARSLGEADEVAVIGHSFGASVAPLVAARVAARHGERLRGAGLTLVTLGGSLNLIGLHPAARRFREALQQAAAAPAIAWIDVSSSYDALNLKRFDPIAQLGLHDPAKGTRSPTCLDTRFGRTVRRGIWGKLDLMRLHMQFIKATEVAGAYDYIALVTSPVPIPQALGAAGLPGSARTAGA